MDELTNCYLFDLDDTIIDSSIYQKIYGELLRRIVEEKKASELELQKYITETKKLSGKEKPDSYELCSNIGCIDLYYEVLEKYARHTYSLKTPSIPAIFKKIKSNHKKIGIVSNSKERTISLFLDRFGLSVYVDFIASGDKSTVLFWIQLERRHSLDKSMTLLIDNSDDILEIAKHTGYKTLNVKNIREPEKFDY